MFIGEAPGRRGADRTGVPFAGDKSGDNFETLLRNIGWARDDIFVTNAVLCNPRSREGNNDPPSRDELARCSTFLQMTLEVVEPEVVVTLGAVALQAIALIQPHTYDLKQTVAQLVPWAGRWLMPMYHPGPRATVHRALAAQRADYFRLSKHASPHDGLRSRASRSFSPIQVAGPDDLSKMAHVIVFLLNRLRRVPKFKLTKLLYLADVAATQSLGRQITGSVYLRQADGPRPPEIDKALRQLANYESTISFRAGMPVVSVGPSPRFEPLLGEEESAILLDVLARYGQMTNSQMKFAAYRTAPMRDMLRREKAGERTLNQALDWVRRT
jgi:uracil-DNA glycosylase family 4